MSVVKLGIPFPVGLVEEMGAISKRSKKSRSKVVIEAIIAMINDYKRPRCLND